MDFRSFVDQVNMPCAVLSVEKGVDGAWGEIRIVCTNRQYKQDMGPRAHDGMLYQELVPQDRKFEDFCYRAAVLGQRMHCYIEVKALHGWIDQTIIPLVSDDERLGYCQFTYEFTRSADPERMSRVSVDTSAAVLKACVTLLRPQDFRENVGAVLDDIMAVSGAFCCRIMLIDREQRSVVTFCERLREEPAAAGLPEGDGISYELARSWEATIGVSNLLILKDEGDMAELAQRNPSWAASMRAYKVQSLVLLPLRQDKRLFGYLYITNFDIEKLVALKELVELLGFILGNEIANHLLISRLDTMSRTDALTGLQNRAAMHQRMERLRGKPFGLVNLDLNGLKNVNDQEGHDAGDRLLIQAAEVLSKIFYHDDIFRTGGDEFIVIAVGISEENFLRKVERLRQDAGKNRIALFSVGARWSDGSVDPRSIFRYADEAMYRDKRAFYEEHPDRRRHLS